MKLSILVPVYNEEKTLSKILDSLTSLQLGKWGKEIVVIDDASTDRTATVLEKYKDSVIALIHPINRGKTEAIKTGIKRATGNYIIIQDADSEYDPKDIPLLLRAAEANSVSAIFGSRFSGKHVDTIFGHKAGNKFLTFLTNLLYDGHISDMETCYKLIPVEFLKGVVIETDRFGFEPEITAKLLRCRKKIVEVPISYSKRTVTEGKSIRWWRDGWATVAVLFKYRFWKL